MSELLEKIKKRFYLEDSLWRGVYQGFVEQHPWDAKLAMDDLIEEVERLTERESNLKKSNVEQEKALWRANRRLNHEKEVRQRNVQEIARLRAENDQLKDDISANNALLDSLYKIEEAIDMQKDGDHS